MDPARFSATTRSRHAAEIRRLLEQFPVVAVLGARQAGEATLAGSLAAKRSSAWFDLEPPPIFHATSGNVNHHSFGAIRMISSSGWNTSFR
jgi:hypothetical protein